MDGRSVATLGVLVILSMRSHDIFNFPVLRLVQALLGTGNSLHRCYAFNGCDAIARPSIQEGPTDINSLSFSFRCYRRWVVSISCKNAGLWRF
jgi:hypothetical protein